MKDLVKLLIGGTLTEFENLTRRDLDHKRTRKIGLCPGVPVHRGNNHCTPFFTNLCLAVEHCWVFCIGSCERVHEDRTENCIF